MVNDTTRLLGLDGLVVVAVEDGTDGQTPVVHLATGDEQARRCPQCATRARRVKQWVTTTPRDLPVAGRGTRLRWRKRRWHCDNTDCDQGTFTESVAQVPPRSRLTRRLRAAAGAAVADAGRTVVQAARDHQVSWPVASAARACRWEHGFYVQRRFATLISVCSPKRSDRGWPRPARTTFVEVGGLGGEAEG